MRGGRAFFRGGKGLLCALSLAAIAGCTPPAIITTTTTIVTTIAVDPMVFLGGVTCSSLPGGMGSYVATITDLGPADLSFIPPPFTQPSSVATPCSLPVNFQYVILGHNYTAQIDGYPYPADALVPLNGPSSGAREMLLGGVGPVIAPRWTTSCGGGEPACAAEGSCAVAQQDIRVVVQPCQPMEDHQGTSAPVIDVDPNATLGTDACTAAGGTVQSFDITPSDPSLKPSLSVPCGSQPLVYSTVVDGRGYTFRIDAKDATDTLIASASCDAVAKEGLVEIARCDLLTDNGVMLIRLAPLLAQAGKRCPADVNTYTVSLPPSALPAGVVPAVGPFPCDTDAYIAPLAPSDQLVEATLTGRSAAGQITLMASCGAVIQPGDVATAVCIVHP
jgi:hypothetical protein